MPEGGRRWTLLTERVVVVVAALVGLRVGLVPIKDNSAFTHLATGIEMVRDGWLPAIPRVDPYTYTAFGHDWVVQSWLPAWIVGGGERSFGLHAVLLISGVTYALLAWLTATLARTGAAGRTALTVALSFAIGATSWAPRPLMLGLVCLAFTILVVERGRTRWWLVPLGWVWVQSHGSFPLGLLFLATCWAGAALSKRDWRGATDELRALGFLAGGVVFGSVNPLGPKLVLFPFAALSKRDVFRHIAEWKPFSIDSPEAAVCAVATVVAIAVCVRRRVPLRVLLPLVVFVLLAISARRNVAALAVVAAWAMGHALSARNREASPQRLDPVIGFAIAALALVFGVTALSGPALNTNPYPVAAIRWSERHGRFESPHHVMSRDWVGNYLELRHGPSGDVFIDDRYDLFPDDLSLAYLDLVHSNAPPVDVLDDYDVDTVIWPSNHELTRRLRSDGWTVGFRQKLGEPWVVLIRPDA